MATENRRHPTRRQVLALVTASAWLPPATAAQAPTLLACWDEGDTHHAGWLQAGADGWQVATRMVLPTRGHGVHAQADGTCWVAARRPGDWLLRWHPDRGTSQWHWVDDDRRLNGHVLTAPGQRLWTTETDQDTAEGRIGVRDQTTLTKVDEWPSHGLDPHAMLRLPTTVGPWPTGTLLVANGGIPTQSESGRSRRDLSRMDPSLVALNPDTGQRLGQWRLNDPRLSIRHLAWDPVSQRVGVALQAEHDDDTDRRHAPLFAAWDGQSLHLGAHVEAGLGYAGDICARACGGFWLSATQAHALLAISPSGQTLARHALHGAGPLAASDKRMWAGGSDRWWHNGKTQPLPTRWRLDNHWQHLVASSTGAG